MRRSLLPILAFATALPSFASAHFLWASLDPPTKTVAIGLQEHPIHNPLPLGTRAKLVRAWTPSSKLALKEHEHWLKAGVKDPCVGVSLDYGVIDRREGGRGLFWLNYFAKAAATPAAARTNLGLPLELVLQRGQDGDSIVTVLDKGRPAPGAEVVVERPDGTVVFKAKTGVGGIVTLPPARGLLAIRGMVTDRTKGIHNGKAYDFVRSYCTLTVPDAAPAPRGKPLTGKLREAFGDNHDVVGRTAFVRTLMSGKLTKPQLEAHFQQRALIHQEVERVLLFADRTKPVPYGEAQSQVLRLLRHDLEAMGSEWPAETKATPLTRKMIQEIRESVKNGPYFALGVLHVYYGGITHGGRDIGARIAKTLNVPQTYYLKSNGYAEYAAQVNGIANPADQKEMIRGGVAAYRYIIASNDDPIFRR